MKFLYSLLLLFSIATASAQIGTNAYWKYIKGDSTYYIGSTYGTQGVTAISNKVGCRQGAATWRDSQGNLWLFGGLAYGYGFSEDLWKYNPATNMWTWIKGDNTGNHLGIYGTKGVADPANNPGSRQLAISWTDALGNFWLFGGQGLAASGTNGYLNDLWKYDISSNQWTWVSGDSVNNQLGVFGSQGVAAA